MNRTYLWKSMAEGLRSGMGDMTWEIGKWYKHDKPLEMCQSGFHASERVIDSMQYIAMENLVKVEVRGESLEQPDKQCWSEMRVVKAWKWEKKDSVALAIFAAELAIGHYEKEYPKDDRPRKAIEAAKAWLKNPTKENEAAARAAADAVYAAVYAATDAADAAYAAVFAAVYAATDSAYAAFYAAVYTATDAAAYAAREGALGKIEAWIQKRIKDLEEIK